MTTLMDDTPLYVYHNTWHEEREVVIVRKKWKFEDAVLLNGFASKLWKIVQRGDWTVGSFVDAVSEELGMDGGEIEPRVHTFLERMIEERLISTRKMTLFEE